MKDYSIISAGRGKTSLSIDETRNSWGDSYHSDRAMLIVVGRASVMSERAKVRKAKAKTESIRRKIERILDSARELANLRERLSEELSSLAKPEDLQSSATADQRTVDRAKLSA